MKVTFFFGVLLLGLFLVQAEAYTIVDAKYLTCYDGDTCTFAFPEWPEPFQKISVRIRGLDAPEIRGKCPKEVTMAMVARNTLRSALATSEHIELRRFEFGKDRYTRILAEVWVDGRNVAELLIRKSLARPYEGGTRKSWCP